MTRLPRSYRNMGVAVCLIVGFFFTSCIPAAAYNMRFPRPPARKNVTIANGGLAITFNIAWGAVVVAVIDSNVAHGLNIVDTHDVGRELQVDQFLHLRIHGRNQLIINPTQAGALGQQAFYKHPKGVLIRESGSRVVRWKAGKRHFSAVIRPLDYDTGKPTKWVYREHVRIDAHGVAQFHYVFYDHDQRSYMMSSEVPTLYSDRTGTFMYPLVSPYGHEGAALRTAKTPQWPVKLLTGAPHFPQRTLESRGWIANIDTEDDIGIFYTTPLGFPESYGTFPGAFVSDAPPLGKTNVVAQNIMARPGMIYSISFSVLVSTPQHGPRRISEQPRATFKILRN